MLKLFLGIFILSSSFSHATILVCSDRVEKVKAQKDKEGLGELGKSVCKGKKKQGKARYKPDSPWKCKTIEDFPCVDNKKLRMVQCKREWECVY